MDYMYFYRGYIIEIDAIPYGPFGMLTQYGVVITIDPSQSVKQAIGSIGQIGGPFQSVDEARQMAQDSIDNLTSVQN